MKRTITIIIGLIATTLLPSCETQPPRAATPPPPVDPAQAQATQQEAARWLGTQFEDVPIPPKFSLDYDASYVSTSSGQQSRVADLRYTGGTALTDILAYTQQSMARSGWQISSLSGVAIKRLRFVKGNEECQLLIRKGDSGESVLIIRIYPRR